MEVIAGLVRVLGMYKSKRWEQESATQGLSTTRQKHSFALRSQDCVSVGPQDRNNLEHTTALFGLSMWFLHDGQMFRLCGVRKFQARENGNEA